VTDRNVPFIVMELLEGRDLASLLAERGPLEPDEVLSIVTQVGKALSRAHAANVLHRDIKPENIFLTDVEGESFVKLLDFGIAKLTEATRLPDSKTKTGQVVGTPFYMSPEQITGSEALDHGADLWSLGVVAFEAMTGRRPFTGETIGGLAVAIVSGPMPVPSRVRPGIPPGFDAWFARACARETDKRFASAKEMADALKLALGGSAPRTVPPIPSSGPEASRPSFAHAPTVESSPAPPIRIPASTGENASVGVSIGPARARRAALPLAGAAAFGLGALVIAYLVSREPNRTAPAAATMAPPAAHGAWPEAGTIATATSIATAATSTTAASLATAASSATAASTMTANSAAIPTTSAGASASARHGAARPRATATAERHRHDVWRHDGDSHRRDDGADQHGHDGA
jgi:serine/threonine-protein kinase